MTDLSNENKIEPKLNSNPNKINKTIRFLISLVLIIVIGYVVLNYVPFIAKYSNHVIVTDSMEPVINVGDVVIIDNSYDIDSLNTGDIIAFNVDLNGDGTKEIVVHYLYSYDEETDIVKTIAHDKQNPDPWEVSSSDILGKHVATVQKIGSFLRFASSTFGKIILIADIIIIYVIFEFLFDEDKKNKKKLDNDIPEEAHEENSEDPVTIKEIKDKQIEKEKK